MTLEEAQATGFVGSFEPGCEVESPPPTDGASSARWRARWTWPEARSGRSRSVEANGVATDPGLVEPGDPVDQAVAAWEDGRPRGRPWTRSRADTYGVWFVQVRNGSEPAFEATANPALETLDTISVPEMVLCE